MRHNRVQALVGTESKPNSVGIWIRVSTDLQVQGDSPQHHEQRARDYAKLKNWEAREVYRLEAVSGKSVMQHSETQRMLADIRSGHITGIIFSKLARLARNAKELLEFSDIFRENNANLISLEESIDTSTPIGRVFYGLIAVLAQWEREEISARVAASVPVRAQLGKPLGGAAPFGYQWKDGKLIPDEKEAPVRKLMYDLFLEHRRRKRVARLLNDMGHRTRSGARFSDTTVERLLRDPTAKGLRRANYTKSLGEKKHWTFKPESDWVFSEVEPIVSEELWNQVNALFSERRRNGTSPARGAVQLFSGLLFCNCGEKMRCPGNTPKYVCRACRNKIGIDDLEGIFQEQLKDFFFSPTEMAKHLTSADQAIKDRSELLVALTAQRERLVRDMDRLMDLYIAGEVPKEGFGLKYRPLDEQRKQLDEQIPAMEAEIAFLKVQYLSKDEILTEARDLYSRWDELSAEDKRRIVETIVQKIQVNRDEIEIELCYLPSPTEIMST